MDTISQNNNFFPRNKYFVYKNKKLYKVIFIFLFDMKLIYHVFYKYNCLYSNQLLIFNQM